MNYDNMPSEYGAHRAETVTARIRKIIRPHTENASVIGGVEEIVNALEAAREKLRTTSDDPWVTEDVANGIASLLAIIADYRDTLKAQAAELEALRANLAEAIEERAKYAGDWLRQRAELSSYNYDRIAWQRNAEKAETERDEARAETTDAYTLVAELAEMIHADAGEESWLKALDLISKKSASTVELVSMDILYTGATENERLRDAIVKALPAINVMNEVIATLEDITADEAKTAYIEKVVRGDLRALYRKIDSMIEPEQELSSVVAIPNYLQWMRKATGWTEDGYAITPLPFESNADSDHARLLFEHQRGELGENTLD